MTDGSAVRLLDDHVINQIAAGEVIERPASVLKELMENSLDAGATSLEVTVLDGGKQLLVVQDDGIGMNRDDALLCLERHATSKIREVHDIEHIDSLGFRGEAMAAIASVSRLSLVTRPAADPEGTRVEVHGGTVQTVEAAGAPPGTRIEVRNLFYNVPARRKFLRTANTELSHVRQMLLVHALAHPDVGFRFTADDRLVYELPPGAALEDRVSELFSPELVRALVPVAYSDVEVQVRGLIGTPQTNRADRSEQILFVNGRPAGAPLMAHAVREAYQATLPKGRHPVMILFVSVDPTQLDVNVHPTKKEVRFRRPNEVRDGLIAALRGALQGGGSPPDAEPAGERDPAPAPVPEPLMPIRDLPLLEPFPYPQRAPDAVSAGVRPVGSEAGVSAEGEPGAPWAWCRILGQVGGLYVVMETDGGMVLMDPQAAHERVLFEQMVQREEGREGTSQGLLVPETVSLPPAAAQRVRDHLAALQAMGFGLAEFGADHFVVDALPHCLGEVSAEPVLIEVAQALDAGKRSSGTGGDAGREAIARAACHAAVHSRRGLKLAELERLVTDLARTEMPYTCPHGRPTLIFQGMNELDRKFGRR